MPCTYRPQPLWLVMGPLLGAFSGAVVATLLVWGVGLVTATSLTWADIWTGFASGLLLGGIWGGACGIAVGLVVGIPFTFLVGRHLPRDVARRRAHVLGAVLPPAAMMALVVIVLDARPTWPDEGEDLLVLLPLAGSAVMGSRLAGWLAGMEDHAAKPVS